MMYLFILERKRESMSGSGRGSGRENLRGFHVEYRPQLRAQSRDPELMT